MNLEPFNAYLLESINDGLTRLFSKEVADALYFCLYRRHSFPKNEVPDHVEEVTSALQRTFGGCGCNVISKVIVRRLYAKPGLTCTSSPSRTLLQYVEEAKVVALEKNAGEHGGE